jgi:hypothetical protein
MNVIIKHNKTWWSVEAIDAEGRTLAFATVPDEASALEIAASYRSRFA